MAKTKLTHPPPYSRRHAGQVTSVKPKLSIVGIGASAGGVEAFKELLSHLATDTGMAFVLILHLSPTHESMLAEILSRATSMPVLQVKGRTKIEPNHVYVIPPNAEMTIDRGNLSLQPRKQSAFPPLPIDAFFNSLAENLQERAVSVVLTGTGKDGAEGTKAIKSAGGITFAQTPSSAVHDSMPTHAIATSNIDFVLTPREIALEISTVSRRKNK